MAKYLLAITGGSMPETEEDQRAAMAAWGAWYGGLGEAIVDPGNPCGPSNTVAPDGSVSAGGASGISGYAVLSADSLDAATDMAKGCPILSAGGTVEVYETFDVM